MLSLVHKYREAIDRVAPSDGRRLGLMVIGAVFGILALGDAFHVIRFPMFELGLPDTVLGDGFAFGLGVGLFVLAYDLGLSVVVDADTLGFRWIDAVEERHDEKRGAETLLEISSSSTGTSTASRTGTTSPFDGRELDVDELARLDDLDPVQTLKVRFALNELADAEFERKLRKLESEDVDVSAHMVNQVENKQTVID